MRGVLVIYIDIGRTEYRSRTALAIKTIGEVCKVISLHHIYAIFGLVGRFAPEQIQAYTQQVQRVDFVAALNISELERALAFASSLL